MHSELKIGLKDFVKAMLYQNDPCMPIHKYYVPEAIKCPIFE